MHNFVILFLGTTFDYPLHNNNYSNFFFHIYFLTLHFVLLKFRFLTIIKLQLEKQNLLHLYYFKLHSYFPLCNEFTFAFFSPTLYPHSFQLIHVQNVFLPTIKASRCLTRLQLSCRNYAKSWQATSQCMKKSFICTRQR